MHLLRASSPSHLFAAARLAENGPVRFRSGSSRSPARVQRILAATDRSETAERALTWAADMAERYEAELLVLQVLTSPADGGRAEAEAELSKRASALAGERGRALVTTADDPAEGIVEAARTERADVVVVGSVGMSGRREFLVGNVPNRVSHNAPCTVVIVDTSRRP
ncbi:MAG: universal stress protein [Actinobacteria bacterium]|nr:MAG: universal stress protein [Actinomycetota bacterium]